MEIKMLKDKTLDVHLTMDEFETLIGGALYSVGGIGFDEYNQRAKDLVNQYCDFMGCERPNYKN